MLSAKIVNGTTCYSLVGQHQEMAHTQRTRLEQIKGFNGGRPVVWQTAETG